LRTPTAKGSRSGGVPEPFAPSPERATRRSSREAPSRAAFRPGGASRQTRRWGGSAAAGRRKGSTPPRSCSLMPRNSLGNTRTAPGERRERTSLVGLQLATESGPRNGRKQRQFLGDLSTWPRASAGDVRDLVAVRRRQTRRGRLSDDFQRAVGRLGHVTRRTRLAQALLRRRPNADILLMAAAVRRHRWSIFWRSHPRAE
jgi:hypothetical protein